MKKCKQIAAIVLLMVILCSCETGLAAGTYVLPSSVTQLEAEAFAGNKKLDSITLKSGVTSIGSKCFYGCSNLYSIEIPKTVTSIGTDCFAGCPGDLIIRTKAGSYAMKWALNNHVDFQADTTFRALMIGQMYEGEESYLGDAPKNDALATFHTLRAAAGTSYDAYWGTDLTADDILQRIDDIFGDAKDQDVSLFFFSGHGVDGNDDPAWNGALCGVGDTYIKVGELRQKLDQIKGRKIIVIDACHSGQLITGESGSMARKKSFQSKAAANSFVNAFMSAFTAQSRSADDFNRYYILTAAAADENSQTSHYDDYPISVFTYFFTKGLGYNLASTSYGGDLLADSNHNGAVSVREIYEYILRNTSDGKQTVQVFPSGCNWMSVIRAK